ncbi:TetR/AcrR family transcriptional regulator [Stackebrandtia nassauensis]|uniref:Transcriptional regulator, TetR family n=1 Tax=Stackebrandtia nassauensis (strain DSM 44728 / CIP 108903 / NRRL B-16338 / NBRC 102104 / LLR-40K-21) TaxID=446470 RepID=D3PUM8_STANL|nr:TetR family transcriptional regulator C-terminal domain-containing protein [Stackebrandtia nassauensis]ADD43041.1 transcriptional regulator, TetR family [Stackebrandtia nassauensis DSM 44728]
MYKVVDREARRAELAEAVWRIIRRDGLSQASVRNVAREAGLSQGSLRHYFTTQAELLAFSLAMVGERIRDRMSVVSRNLDGPDMIAELAEAVMPLDEDRRVETEVWLAFLGAALTDPALRSLNDETFDGVHHLFTELLTHLVELGQARTGLDVVTETARLHALVDGLAMHGVVRPDVATPEHLRHILTTHITDLCHQ